jgi:GH15 family glucan-1,4-alpha-glucosidase
MPIKSRVVTDSCAEPEFETHSGSVALVDCMTPRGETPELLRLVIGKRGQVRMNMELVIRFDYGSVIPWVRRTQTGISAIAGPDMLSLRTQVPLRGENFKTVADFTVNEGQQIPFDLAWYPSTRDEPSLLDFDKAIQGTQEWWREWSDRCSYQGKWRDAVLRSYVFTNRWDYGSAYDIASRAARRCAELGLPFLLGTRRHSHAECATQRRIL